MWFELSRIRRSGVIGIPLYMFSQNIRLEIRSCKERNNCFFSFNVGYFASVSHKILFRKKNWVFKSPRGFIFIML